MLQVVDLVVLSRDDRPLHAAIQRGIDSQRGVRLRVHRVYGRQHPADKCRWQTIARARNAGKRLGSSPWLMFLDDDVQLLPDCVYRLVRALRVRQRYAALSANYRREGHLSGVSKHVAMGATLFRRSALDSIEFRFENDRCECQCCCDDLRTRGYRIAYLPTARARHAHSGNTIESVHVEASCPESIELRASGVAESTGTVLACFNRRHYQRFLRRFIPSFRASGNREQIIAVGIGLFPSELRRLQRMWNVEVHGLRDNGVPAQIRRLHEFPRILSQLGEGAMAAFWDAGDVLFQQRIQELWSIADQNRGKLLIAREPFGHPRNIAVRAWTETIENPIARQRIFDLVAPRPFLNSGFAAGTNDALLEYCHAAAEVQRSADFKGTKEWADQLAMNVYCHENPAVWQEIDSGWNYCLCTRLRGDFRVLPSGRYVRVDGGPIYAVHGNGRTLDWKVVARHYS
jgi:hypothetical protein